MGNQNNDILKHLIADSELEKAPSGFTEEIMQRIDAETESKSVFESFGLLSPNYWLLIGSAVGILIIFVITYDFPFLSDFVTGINIKDIINLGAGLLNGGKEFFQQIQVSSISVAIVVGVLVLFLLDRFLKKRFSFNLFMV